jgi:hypothetical protein
MISYAVVCSLKRLSNTHIIQFYNENPSIIIVNHLLVKIMKFREVSA